MEDNKLLPEEKAELCSCIYIFSLRPHLVLDMALC